MNSVASRSDTQHRKTTLANGIRVISEWIPHIHSITLGVWVWSGSRFESPENNGIAHFLEHMLFKGTYRRDAYEIARTIESLGGYLNAFTGRELNCFFVRVLMDDDAISIDLLADILQNSNFDPCEIEKEKGVVIDEIHGMEDSPEELVLDHFNRIVWQPHPLSKTILGTSETVASFQDTDLRSYQNTHYLPEQTYIVATGAVDHHRLVDLVEAAFPLVTGKPVPQMTTLEPPGPQRIIVSKDISQAHLCLGGIGLPYNDPRKYTLYVLNTLLGGGMTSRLFQTIREQEGLAYTIYSDVDFLYDTGIFSIYAGTDAEDLPRVIEAVFDEMKNIQTVLITDLELRDAKAQLTGGLLLSLESSSNVMNRLARLEIYLDTYESVEHSIAAVEAVTAEQVIELANELFSPDRISLAAVGPLGEKDLSATPGV
ncbi:MAG: pitrilysin family protein [Gemmatimonadota bacterium]|nr:pitrilysin family protein [Gemmatimonadota bacterium]